MIDGFVRTPRGISRLLSGAIVLVGMAAAGAGQVTGASDPAAAGATAGLSQADQIAAGTEVFQQICSKCHGDNGQGGDGPTLIGAGNAVADYRNARRLFDFVSSSMPDDAPGSLATQQYYDVIAFLLSSNGWNAAGQTVDPSTAESILTR
jgi:mono/diheme cytochrome c family protein